MQKVLKSTKLMLLITTFLLNIPTAWCNDNQYLVIEQPAQDDRNFVLALPDPTSIEQDAPHVESITIVRNEVFLNEEKRREFVTYIQQHQIQNLTILPEKAPDHGIPLAVIRGIAQTLMQLNHIKSLYIDLGGASRPAWWRQMAFYIPARLGLPHRDINDWIYVYNDKLIVITHALAQLTQLESLVIDISCSYVGPDGVIALFQALENLPHLQSCAIGALFVRGSDQSRQTYEQLKEARTNHGLPEIEICRFLRSRIPGSA